MAICTTTPLRFTQALRSRESGAFGKFRRNSVDWIFGARLVKLFTSVAVALGLISAYPVAQNETAPQSAGVGIHAARQGEKLLSQVPWQGVA